jgi:mono/diheme cytochrome c family protein
MENTIKRLQVALGLLLIALVLVVVAGAVTVIHFQSKPVAIQPPPVPINKVPVLDAVAQKGEQLFKNNNCATCHALTAEVLVGPGLQGVAKRRPEDWLVRWIRNSTALIASGDEYGNQLFNKFNKVAMPSYPNLKDEDIRAILRYVEAKGG